MNFNWHLIRKWQCSLTFRVHLLKYKLLHKKQQQRCIFIAGVHWTISGSVIMMQVLRDGEHYRASRWSPVEWREREWGLEVTTQTLTPPHPHQSSGHNLLLLRQTDIGLCCVSKCTSVQRRNGKFSSYKWHLEICNEQNICTECDHCNYGHLDDICVEKTNRQNTFAEAKDNSCIRD